MRCLPVRGFYFYFLAWNTRPEGWERKRRTTSPTFFPLTQTVWTEAAALHEGSELNATSDAHVDSGWAHYPLGDPPPPPHHLCPQWPWRLADPARSPGLQFNACWILLLLNKAVYYSSNDYIFPYTSKTMLVPTQGCIQNGRINLCWNNIICLYFL